MLLFFVGLAYEEPSTFQGNITGFACRNADKNSPGAKPGFRMPKKPRRFYCFHLTNSKKSSTIIREQTFARNELKGSTTIGILVAIFSAAFEGETPPTVPAWVEWEHVAMGMTHCPVCLKLDGCWFTDENKPTLPQHLFCRCQVNPLSFSLVFNDYTIWR